MSSSGQTTLPPTRRARKSIGAHTDARKAADKENATMDLGSNSVGMNRKSRSKSLGPGGMDALKHGNGNRRASIAAPSKPPRSILKPAVTSLPEIPPLNNKGSQKSAKDDTLSGSHYDNLSGSKIALRTEEEQQATAREREERERRDARRKSLANRRVSFAAEATLHTFHEIEYMQDKTASTHASRRRSSVSNNNNNNDSGNDHNPSSQERSRGNDEFSQEEGEYDYRRDQGASHFRPRDDDTATTMYSSDSEPVDAIEEEIVEEDDGSDSDSDDGTMMSMVTEEVTGTSMGSDRTDAFDDEGESSTLDEALRLAAQRAGTQSLGQDDEDDESDEEIIPSFGWIKKGGDQASAKQQQPPPAAPATFDDPSSPIQDGTEMDMDMDMEMTSAVGKILKPNVGNPSLEDDMSIDVTRAYGGIIRQSENQQDKQAPPEEEDEQMEEATMEFTTAIGGIRSQMPESEGSDDNEDMSMELTTIMGGVLGKQKRKSLAMKNRKSLAQDTEAGDLTMDMTVGVGRILPEANHDWAGDDGDETMGMDITTAIGGILNKKTENTQELGQRMLEEDMDFLNHPRQNGAQAGRRKSSSPAKRLSPKKPSPEVVAENESPGLSVFRGNGLRYSNTQRPLPLHEPSSRNSNSRTPSPAKISTPRGPSASSSPVKSAQASRRSARLSSPEKLSNTATAKKTPSPANPGCTPSSIFRPQMHAEIRSSPIVLTPQPRKLSGVGADRNGLGSPRVTALFDRRTSLGEAAMDFVPKIGRVAFQDPKELDDDTDDQEETNSHGPEAPQEDKNATLNLREMIDSLSPKRNTLKGRKSLHVGSARGLLGKRPAELDEEAETEAQDGVKRLKKHQGSPVKNIRLQKPPSKEETAPTLVSPTKNRLQRSPARIARFADVDETTTSVMDGQDSDQNDQEDEMSGDRLHLQDFLNMTSIRFMELTTTKRRQTVAPSIMQDGSSTDGRDDMSLERCVVTGACTVPTLELYQHSCRELKKYISEGRRIVKEIETDTFEENPPLFREYISATPEVKALMDNQFKNVKTHARLLSKAMWYEWRMKLQDGLKEGLVRILDDMATDDKFLQTQSDLLRSVLPKMVENYDMLREQSQNLEEAAQELADCDPDELEAARNDLSNLDHDIAAKKKRIAELRKLYEDSEKDVEALTAKKHVCISDIKESEKIREECRGWTSAEVDAIKGRVDAIEAEHGWAVTGIRGTMISMTYRREIELVFDVSAFDGSSSDLGIDLWYVADNRDMDPIPRTAEKEFFVQCIRNHVCSLAPGQTTVSDVLAVVRSGWDKATKVSSQIKRVNISFPTTVSKTSETSVAVCSSLLLVPLATRVEVTLNLHGRSSPQGIVVGISPEARVIYGEHFNVLKIGEFLSTKLGGTVTMGPEAVWSDAAVELHERLIARGKKA